MDKKLLSLYGLKWNPFIQELPMQALISNNSIKHFCWKVENLVMNGGFALVTGSPGLGKSVILRILYERLCKIGDLSVAEFTRPQSNVLDFYRELGRIFKVNFIMGNRFAGYQELREKWNHHINASLFRPVLLIDESQEMSTEVLSELRLLVSTKFDSRIILTVVLSGDRRILDRLEHENLLPLKSRIRTRLVLENYTSEELIEMLKESIDNAGNSNLMTEGLIKTIAEHAVGNPRTMMTMCSDLLLEALNKEVPQLDEKLFLELFSNPRTHRRKK